MARRTSKEAEIIKNNIYKDAQDGFSIKEIAERNGISTNYVSKFIKVKKLTKEQNESIVREYLEGNSIADIAILYGVNKTTIRNKLKHLEQYQQQAKKFHRIKGDRLETIISSYKNGDSLNEIAEKTNTDYNSVLRIVRNAGIYEPRNEYENFEIDLSTVSPRGSFPVFDTFELKPEHRERLEQLRQAKIKRWMEIHKKDRKYRDEI